MAGKLEKGRAKPLRAAAAAVAARVDKVPAGPGGDAAAVTGAIASLLCEKGNASASGFRPWHWSYEPTAAQGPHAAPPPLLAELAAALGSSSEGRATNAPVGVEILAEVHPQFVPVAVPTALELPYQAWPSFDYPCNSVVCREPVAREPAALRNRPAERAALLATTRLFSTLIGDALQAQEAAALARRQEQREAHGFDADGRRRYQARPQITCEGLIAELEAARRGSVRALRRRVRPFAAALLASAWSR